MAAYNGTEGNDTYTGTADGDTIVGNGGNDTLNGGGGRDLVDGGDGNDVLDGGTDTDILRGAAGDDIYFVDDAGDQVVENVDAGNDWINSLVTYTLPANVEGLSLALGTGALDATGNALDNVLVGNDSSNHLIGGDGRDQLYGQGGDDILEGGDDDDVYYVGSLGDTVIETSSGGMDLIVADVDYMLPDYVESLFLSNLPANGSGNAFDNVIVGNASANVLDGGGGDDTLDGDLGNDTLRGGAGSDTASYISSAAGSVQVDLSAGTATGADGSDTLESIENVVGSQFADVIRGDFGSNRLDGAEGNDILDGGAGADFLEGGFGDDTYYVDSPGDLINDWGGVDVAYTTASYVANGGIEQLRLLDSSSADAIDLTGFVANETLVGNAGTNVLSGLSGSDKLAGLAGNDTLDGGEGVDRLIGGLGDDRYVVDDYGDRAVEASGEGADAIIASANYKLALNVEKLTLTRSADIWAYGNGGDNVLTGNSGANKLYGLDGADTLNGGSGNDLLQGGAGLDRLFGGAGNDGFVFDDGDFAGLTASTCDQIKDFATGDRIRLNLVDANTLTAGDQAFAFVGTAAFSNTAGELRYEQVGGNTLIEGDTNGDAVADFMIRLDGLHTLSASDLVL